MKNVLPNSLMLVLLMSFLYFACDSNLCQDTFCGARQQCNPGNGACFCQHGYEGDNCDQVSVEKYTAGGGSRNYNIAANCFGGSGGFTQIFNPTCFAQPGFQLNEIQLCGLLQINPNCVTANIFTDPNTNRGVIVDVPLQQLGATEIQGTGLAQLDASGNTIVRIQMNFNVTAGFDFFECQVTMTPF